MKYKKSLSECAEFISGDKVILREILHPDKEELKLGYSLAWFKVLPKHKSARHSLKSSEIYFLISGNGCMHIDDETIELGPNDTVYIPPNAVQWIDNLSETESIIALCIVDPAWKKEDEKIYS